MKDAPISAKGSEAPAIKTPGAPTAAKRPKMLRQFELIEKVRSYDPTADEALLNRAYVYAMRMHGAQKRASGDPYFAHPIEGGGASSPTIASTPRPSVTALLHDVIEDTPVTRKEIDELFGVEIGELVEGVTKLSKLNSRPSTCARPRTCGNSSWPSPRTCAS